MRNYSLDTLKLICAILVVAIHAPTPQQFDPLLYPILRTAVPIFFIMSGYFLEGKENIDKAIGKRLKNILILFVWSSILYLLISIAFDGLTELEKISKILSPGFIIGNSHPYGDHLWYIHSYIYVLLVLLFAEKYKLKKTLFKISPILLFTGVLIGKYGKYTIGMELPLPLTRNFIFTGIPFFILGMATKHIHPYIKRKNAAWGCLIFYIAGIIEESMLGFKKGDMYLSTPFLSLSIFILFLNTQQTKDNILSKTGREDGLYIYVLHFFIIRIINHYHHFIPYHLYSSTILATCFTLLLIHILRRVKIIGKII